MDLHGLFPAPVAPYSGVSVSELYTKIQRIRSPAWCPLGRSKKGHHSCNLLAKIIAIADPITRLADGPELKDFEIY